MSTLTLTLDDDLLQQAEAYARRTGTDLSQVAAEPPVFSPEVAALLGCISLPADYDYKEYLADLITDRKHA